jgi:hypothetical protein
MLAFEKKKKLMRVSKVIKYKNKLKYCKKYKIPHEQSDCPLICCVGSQRGTAFSVSFPFFCFFDKIFLSSFTTSFTISSAVFVFFFFLSSTTISKLSIPTYSTTQKLIKALFPKSR